MYIKLPGCHRNVLYIFNLDDAVTKLFNSSINNKKKKKRQYFYVIKIEYEREFMENLLPAIIGTYRTKLIP